MQTIREKIIQHLDAYLSFGLSLESIPTFRITPKEHKELVKTQYKFIKKEEKDIIVDYHGVRLELVVEIGDIW